MGFFSDLMKSPIMQMVAPMALGWAMPHLGITGLLGGIQNPMMRSAVEQSLLGYGTAKLTGSKHPEKAAMYAGLGSMPFSFMKSSNAANLYNEKLTGLQKNPSLFQTKQLTPKITASAPWTETIGPGGLEQQLGIGSQIYHPEVISQPSTWGMSDAGSKFLEQEQLTPWEVLKGPDYLKENIVPTPTMRDMEIIDATKRSYWDSFKDDAISAPKATFDPPATSIPEVDLYSKIGTGEKNLLGGTLKEGKEYTDWLPTIASQTAGWYGGRPTEEEEWEDAKSRRRKELAFMYGVPENMLGGELQNPYYGGGGFWKDGGIAALEMDAGGAVNGPGGPKDDVIDAKLSDGEFVMTAKAVENLGGGNRLAGAKQMYQMMNQLDPQSETVQESVIGV
jgi:hypothetical protein